MKALNIGKLRHRITLQQNVPGAQDPVTGEITSGGWAVFAANVPAEVVPSSVRDFIAAREGQVEVSARCVIRYMPGVLDTMRVLFDGQVYEIAGVLPDPTARRYLTLALKTGVPYVPAVA